MSEKTFDNVKITSSFNVPETRENLVSGETIGQHFGKIAKVIEDLENGEFDTGVSIDDTSTTDTNKTWSAKKISESIPTSLPANGGNAATVGGKSASDFMAISALATLQTSINDLVNATVCGVQAGVTPDVPTGYGTWGLCDVRRFGSICYQTIKYETGVIFNRAKIVGQTDWGAWKEISTTPLKSTTVSGTTNAYSDLIILNASSGKIPVFVAYADTYCTPFLSPAGYYYAHMVSAYGNDMGTVAIDSATVYYIQT